MTTSWTLALGRYDFARTALVYVPTPPSVQVTLAEACQDWLAAKHGLKSSTLQDIL